MTIGDELGALCYWRKNPKFISAAIQAWPPGTDFEMAWNIMMRVLEGQGPKVQSILTKPLMMNFEQVSKILKEDCNVDSDGWYNVPIQEWASKEYLDAFFLRPADPEAFKK
jgi:ribose transport system substrate-binding protein